uniref:Uncharacterized protein n=1 Tax=Haptolina brevifila TaxID=156173 RepID=A0A7S2FLF2_9EUKA|mmetsp:Transcript_13509/g.27184  ORF Transcript_13509/g.27184 Transcript_13509/m.27184 type:complete len:119 (+) Transcript_13509:97-453(+)
MGCSSSNHQVPSRTEAGTVEHPLITVNGWSVSFRERRKKQYAPPAGFYAAPVEAPTTSKRARTRESKGRKKQYAEGLQSATAAPRTLKRFSTSFRMRRRKQYAPGANVQSALPPPHVV